MAQRELLSLNGGSRGTRFGTSVAMVPDVNLDGYPDFAVGLPNDDTAAPNAGQLRVYSGKDGKLLFSFNGLNANDQFGYSIAGIPDVDGDGRGEILVGAPFSDASGGNSGQVRLVSGTGTATLLTLNGSGAGDRFGTSVAYGGSTGIFPFITRRLVIGAPYESNGSGGEGRVFLSRPPAVSSTSGSARRRTSTSARRSRAASTPPMTTFPTSSSALPTMTPRRRAKRERVVLFSGSNVNAYAQLKALVGSSAGEHLGASVCLLDDMNGNGLADFAFGAPDASNGAGAIWIYDGSTGANIHASSGNSAGDHYGFAICSAGDLTGDGRPEYFVGAPDDTNNGAQGTGDPLQRLERRGHIHVHRHPPRRTLRRGARRRPRYQSRRPHRR